ncbi:MAG: thioredoxin family protein [Odoribacter sp.]|nr:thioredoxin family protein [Odoribacter sp.]
MKRKLFLFLFTCVIGLLGAQAQLANPTNWSFSHKSLGDNEYELIFKATISPTWSIYSMYTPEGGPLRTSLVIEGVDEKISLLGEAEENEPHKKFDDIFKTDVWYFTGQYEIKQKIKVKDDALTSVVGTLEYQVCREGECVLFDTDFDIKLDDRAIVVAADDTTTEQVKDENLWWFFLLGVGYGLLAIIMPCVLPMIPMTVSFFMHSDSNKAKAKSKVLFFSLSIVAIFTALGMLVSIFLGPDFINWLSTNWIPNVLFFLIFITFAASFFGAFEIVVPSWLVNKSDKQADKGGYIGAFFMAFTLVLVSFSCTAPFIGNLLVEAARGGVLRPIIGMLGFSIALALPFGFFAFFPSKLSSLPKSGGWLNSVKVVLGFIEIALGLKFLMVADQTYHWGLLDREVYIAIWIAVFTLQGLYLMGKIRFKHDSELPYIGIGRLAFIIATFTFVVYLIPGMFGAPLKALAGYLPPQETIDFDINRIVRENARDIIRSGGVATMNSTSSSITATADCEPPKYANFLHLPHGLEGYFDYEQGLKCAKAQNKPLFIDFTGHGCVNCCEMEQSVWSDPRILDMLRNEYVIVALYVDDKKTLPEDEWYVSEYDGKKKKTLGKKNSDFQIKHFHSNAQPNYILLDSRVEAGDTLEDFRLMPPRGHSLDKDAFYTFLKEGLEKFKNN